MKALINKEAWERYLLSNNLDVETNNPGLQEVRKLSYYDPFDATVELVSFDGHYFHISELELI